MSRYIGNYLRVPSSEPQQSSAPGVWSLSDQLAYQRANLWPPARDPYYNQTVLHLSGDVAATKETNPVTQPRTFLSDASTNNFLLTPNGDVSARPFSPYASSYSNYFNGSSSYLSLSNTVNLRPGTSDFTTEFWIYRAGPSGGNTAGTTTIWGSQWSGASPSGAWILYMDSTFKLTFAIWLTSIVQSISTINLAQWYHIAITRSGTTFKLFVNGNLESVGTSSLDANNSAYSILIGLYNDPGISSGYFNGYLSNLRFVKGTALYTTNFTPSLTPLTAVPGTQLLTCQSNRFIDTSSNAFTITPNGSPVVAQNSPFVDYDTTSGSGYFDGTDDYIATPSNAAFGFSGTWTIECWFYVATTSGSRLWQISNEVDNCEVNSPSAGYVNYYNGSSSVNSGAAVFVPFSWTHLAAVCTANSTKIYVNGVLAITHSTSNTTARSINIGGSSNLDFLGYISNFRVVKGTAVYTGNFTPPTAPITNAGSTSAASYSNTANVNTSFAESNTSLLTLQTRAPANNQGILDTSPNSFVVTRTGNVAQGSFSPFSPTGWGAFFDGSSGYLSVAGSSNLNSTGDFTLEAWAYVKSASAYAGIVSMRQGSGDTAGAAINILNSGLFEFSVPPGGSYSGTAVPLNQWFHVALVRSGSATNNCSCYLNGNRIGQFTSTSQANGAPNVVMIGRYYATGSNLYWIDGWISNVRYVVGTALYSGTSIPVPTSELTAVSGTQLLACQSNRFIDRSANNYTITRNGTVNIVPFSPFAPTQAYVASQLGGSAYFDGSDYLDIPIANSSVFDISGAFSLECWFYYTSSSPGNSAIIGKGGGSPGWSTTNGNQWGLLTDGGSLYWMVNNGSGGNWSISTTTPASFTWHHVAISYNGTTTRVWLNGSSIGTNTSSYGLPTTRNMLRIGVLALTTPAYYHTGHISGLHFVQGRDLYNVNNTNIVIPTAPPISTQNTSLLLNFTGAGIVDSTGKNVVETVGNSAVQTTQSRWPPGSMYFDGTGDYLVVPSSQFWTLGSTEDFTIEFWFYTSVTVPISGSTPSTLISNYPDWNTWTNRWAIAANDNKIKWFDHNGNYIISSNNFTYSVWNHVAVVRNSGSIKMYMNGTQEGSTQTTTQTYTTTEKLYVGFVPSGVAFNGYIDDLRITKGYARYVVGTGGNAGQMVFNGTTTLAFPTINTRPFPLA